MNVFELFGTIAINNKDANSALKDTAQQADRTGKQIQEAFKKVGSATLKVGKAVVGGAVAVASAWAATIETTRDYRTAMAKLDTAYLSNGHSAETAMKTYKALQAVLGDTDQAVEAANHLAVMCDSEEDLAKWTDICMGVYATFGDSLPIEGLTEAANETAKTGVVTGSLADALNWAGISEEDFNLKLRACRTEQERQSLIMNTLFGQYKSSAEQYKVTGESVMKANAAQENLNSALAKLGEIGEPIMTGLKNWVADMVNAAAPHIQTLIDKLANFDTTMETEVWPWLQKEAKAKLGVELPDWGTFKGNVQTWWTDTKTNLEGVMQWALQIPDKPHESAEQMAAVVSGWWTTTALPAIKNVSKWSLNLFGHPVEDNAAIKAHVKEWWNVAADAVAGACNWTLRLFGMPDETADTITNTARDWWVSYKDFVIDACSFTARFMGFGEWTDADDQALKTWWENVYEKIVEVCTWEISMPTLPDIVQMGEKITAWWSDVVSNLHLVFGITPQIQASYSTYSGDIAAASGGSTAAGLVVDSFTTNSDAWGIQSAANAFMNWVRPDSSNASGLDYVPSDGYMARVHKGEAILNKEQADQWRGGGFDVDALASRFASSVAAALSGMPVVLDSGALVGQLAPAMDTRLGTIGNRKGRGN